MVGWEQRVHRSFAGPPWWRAGHVGDRGGLGEVLSRSARTRATHANAVAACAQHLSWIAAPGRSLRSMRWDQELDCEADWTSRLDEVLDIRRDALRLTRLDDDVGHGCRLSDEAQTAVFDVETAPRPAGHTVSSAQRVRHGVLIEGGRRSNDHEVAGNLGAIAQRTSQRRADPLPAGDVVDDPRGRPQRWTVSDMLTMVAVQPGDPVTGVIPVEPCDPALHGPSVGSVRPLGDHARPCPFVIVGVHAVVSASRVLSATSSSSSTTGLAALSLMLHRPVGQPGRDRTRVEAQHVAPLDAGDAPLRDQPAEVSETDPEMTCDRRVDELGSCAERADGVGRLVAERAGAEPGRSSRRRNEVGGEDGSDVRCPYGRRADAHRGQPRTRSRPHQFRFATEGRSSGKASVVGGVRTSSWRLGAVLATLSHGLPTKK